jgi:glycosyltransferase involved in cell wall biosynthesis
VSPRVSVIVPCYNEAESIGWLLEALARQDLRRARVEVVIADGRSEDSTRAVVRQAAQAWPRLAIRVVDNPDRTIPAALNRAIAASRGDILVRLDAHSIPAPDYLRRCLDSLTAHQAANVGGVWEIEPGGRGWMARSIARAAAHPLGAGDARYRIRGAAGPVETVPFGAFPRSWLRRVGGFDETLLTNEDYEFNHRLRQAGGLVWFDPSIRSSYTARRSLPELWRQYARYGFWKARMLLRHPRSLRWRQALPPLFVLTTVLGLVLGMWWPAARRLLAIEWAAYALVLLAAALAAAIRDRSVSMILGLPVVWASMHLVWGGSFWIGLGSGAVRPPGRHE